MVKNIIMMMMMIADVGTVVPKALKLTITSSSAIADRPRCRVG